MRQIHTYRVIRYFPHVLSDEFINVGVVLTSAKNKQRILTDEEAARIHCPALIGERKKFLGIIAHLGDLAAKGALLETEHYFHNFRFADERQMASSKRADEIVNDLFDDYIGFKLHTEAKKEQKTIIVETSMRLVEHSFKRYVRVRRGQQFDLEFESVKAGIVHHSNVGKSSLKHDAMQMAFSTPDVRKPDERYDFLDLTGEVDKESFYVKKMEQNFVDVYPYKEEEQIAKYLEKIAAVA